MRYVFEVGQDELALQIGEFALEVDRSSDVFRGGDWQPGLLSLFVLALSEFTGFLADSQRFVDCILHQGRNVRPGIPA
jgi:hypothetical protein